MNQKELFQHYVMDVRTRLEEGADARELVEVLAAVSLDLALNVAPSPVLAFSTVLEGLRDMAMVHAKRNEAAKSDSAGSEKERGSRDSTDEGLGSDTAIAPSMTIH